jgi:hypothetical protein
MPMLPPGTIERFAVAAGAAIALVFATVQPAGASINLAFGGTAPALRIDARGNAWVSFTTGGVRHTTFVPPRGKPTPHVRLTVRDVSRPAPNVRVPFGRVVRRTPDGRFWAIQIWQINKGGPTELHFSRWRGAPTKASLTLDEAAHRLEGSATFHGTPVPLYSPDDESVRFRHYAYLSCSGCPAAGGAAWGRMLGAAVLSGGAFALYLRPQWLGTRYRALVVGPNLGGTLAPDGAALAP